MVKKNERLTLEITGYAFEGKGIAKIPTPEGEQFVVFIQNSYPGDTVECLITKKKKNYAEGRVTSIVTPSPFRIQPVCKYFRVCGGCKQQDMQYARQLHYKEAQTLESFQHIGGFSDLHVEPILGSAQEYFYRNKMEFSFSSRRWLFPGEMDGGEVQMNPFALGLHIPGVFDKVVDIEECFLQSKFSNGVLNATREFFLNKNQDAYTIKNRDGLLRNLVIRESATEKDKMVNLVTSREEDTLMKEYTAFLLERFPEVTTIVNNINLKPALVAVGDYEIVYHGSGQISDRIGNNLYHISANSFFQTNTLQATQLYQTALDFAELRGDEVVYDLYCGAGTIALFFAPYCKSVYGFETVASSVKDAATNTTTNGVTNARFFAADLNNSFLPVCEAESVPKPDLLIADPPRSGMHPGTVQDILMLRPSKIVYISCNPATQARDCKMLAEGGYNVQKIRPVDMFPQTWHIENVALLTLNQK